MNSFCEPSEWYTSTFNTLTALDQSESNYVRLKQNQRTALWENLVINVSTQSNLILEVDFSVSIWLGTGKLRFLNPSKLNLKVRIGCPEETYAQFFTPVDSPHENYWKYENSIHYLIVPQSADALTQTSIPLNSIFKLQADYSFCSPVKIESFTDSGLT